VFCSGETGDGHPLGAVHHLAKVCPSSRNIGFKIIVYSDNHVSPAAGVAKTFLPTVFMLAYTLTRSRRIVGGANATTGWLATAYAIGSSTLQPDDKHDYSRNGP
jgi:hypothetical protein